jgi:cytochrome c-type biogenesis protein CcmH/NrfG
MTQSSKPLKGYIKTESMILVVVVTLMVGFLGGVVFSAYRTSSRLPMPGDSQATGGLPLSPEQSRQISALEDQTRQNPKDVEALTQLGHLYFDTGQPVKAIEAYEKSLALDSSRPDVWTDLGVMYRRNNDPQKAVETFEKALSLKPDHQIALFNKGVVLMHDLNDLPGALESWDKLVIINPQAQTPGGDSIAELVRELKKNLATGAVPKG